MKMQVLLSTDKQSLNTAGAWQRRRQDQFVRESANLGSILSYSKHYICNEDSKIRYDNLNVTVLSSKSHGQLRNEPNK
jgi:hypothetical protein